VFSLDMDMGTGLGAAGWKDWAWPAAGVLLACVSVLGCLLLRRWATPMAMLFSPRATATLIQHRAWAMAGAWTAYFAVTYVGLLAEYLESGSKIPAQLLAMGLIFGAMIGGWIRMALSAGLLRLSLSLLKCRTARFDGLLAALVTGAFPMVPFTLGALMAVQGHVTWLHKDFQAQPGHMPGILVAGVLMSIGYGWSLVASICAVAGVAGISRRRSLAGFALVVGLVLLLIGIVVAIVKLTR
jgi:hypothetical protein